MTENQHNPHLNPLAGERASNEPDAAVIAVNDWLRLGPGRSLPRLLAVYAQKETKSNQNEPFFAPTTSLDTLKQWSARFDWQNRAALYDAEWERRRNELHEAEMMSGMALPANRVARIKEVLGMVESLIGKTDADGPDLSNGNRRIAEGYHRRLKADLLKEKRALLAELAKETGINSNTI